MAVYGECGGGMIKLRGMYADASGRMVTDEIQGDAGCAERWGETLAQRLKKAVDNMEGV